MDKTERYNLFYELLKEWNEKFNLTTIIEREKVNLLHFEDSISAKDFIKKGAKLLDVGSGAGFPGIPLKIERDDLDVTLIDSVNKKVVFMNEVIKKLELSGIRAIHSRIEDYKTRDFDVVTSRAVAALNILAEYCLPFVKKGGKMIAYKGQYSEQEENEAKAAIKLLGGKIEEVKKTTVGEYQRTIYIIEKVGVSPVGYPRSGNKARLKPIR